MSELDEVREFIERMRRMAPKLSISAMELARIDNALETVYDACDMMRLRIKWVNLSNLVLQGFTRGKVSKGPYWTPTGSAIAEVIESTDLWEFTEADTSYLESVEAEWKPIEDRED